MSKPVLSLHAVTAVLAILGALGAQSQLGLGKTHTVRTVRADAAVTARVDAIEAHLDALHKMGCANRQEIVREINERGSIMRRFLLDAAAARQRSAQLEAIANPEQSNVDFQAATDFQHMVSEVQTLPAPTC